MNVDKIEKLEKFPNFFNYIGLYLRDSFELIFIILISIVYFFSLFTALSFIIIVFLFEYFIDKKIFNAFEVRRMKNDSN